MAPKALDKLQALRNFKGSMWFLFVPHLISRIPPSTPQAPPNIQQTEIVICLQLITFGKFIISCTKL